MQARRIARELALMSIGQMPADRSRLQAKNLEELVLASVRTLREEANESLQRACTELRQGHNRLEASELTAPTVEAARREVAAAIALAEQAINRVGASLELPEFVRLADELQVRAYAFELLGAFVREGDNLDKLLDTCMEGWQVERLTRIDRDILRLALVEMVELKSVPLRVAIDEAVELAKKYSTDTAVRFINGVLRRVVQHLQLEQRPRR
ncbi:transcription antitermination factor NusB [Gloeobacter morelensis]|uniref:Transcription antitermination protein NusB n=1 Tax=Gloeobacter morelensis MG652769 TaxID=2781736 RepID=A0ABY3PJU8_9CYAN|nr:transcription antitermination factor NusB [Gloeobacter morelensis]UFP93940.1 transcription antitermination protein NusB [Gloeobacter morelensis MG652769]